MASGRFCKGFAAGAAAGAGAGLGSWILSRTIFHRHSPIVRLEKSLQIGPSRRRCLSGSGRTSSGFRD